MLRCLSVIVLLCLLMGSVPLPFFPANPTGTTWVILHDNPEKDLVITFEPDGNGTVEHEGIMMAISWLVEDKVVNGVHQRRVCYSSNSYGEEYGGGSTNNIVFYNHRLKGEDNWGKITAVRCNIK